MTLSSGLNLQLSYKPTAATRKSGVSKDTWFGPEVRRFESEGPRAATFAHKQRDLKRRSL
jgi:hypothetical protein